MPDTKPADKPIDELVFLIEVHAKHGKEMKVPPRKGLAKIFGRRLPPGWHAINGDFSETAQGPLDHSTVATVFDDIREKNLAAIGRLNQYADNPPHPDFDYTRSIRTEVWVGRKDQFAARYSSAPQILTARDGKLGAQRLGDGQCTPAYLHAFISRFNTRETLAAAQAAEAAAADSAIKNAIRNAVEPVKDIKPLKQLQLRKGR